MGTFHLHHISHLIDVPKLGTSCPKSSLQSMERDKHLQDLIEVLIANPPGILHRERETSNSVPKIHLVSFHRPHRKGTFG